MDWDSAISVFLLLSAPFVGSFLDLMIDRWPRGEPFVRGRSYCTCCGQTLEWRDLIPVASWIASRGRCRHCGAPIPIRHPVVETSALAIAIWSEAVLQGPLSWIGTLFGWALLAIALADIRWFWLPDRLTLPLCAGGIATVSAVEPSILIHHLVGVAAGFAVLAAAAWLYRRLRNREGLGRGDPKLLGAIGAWVGWQGLGSVLLYAALSGLLLVLIQRATGRTVQRTAPLPFGSYLCLGAWLVWLYGPIYMEWDGFAG